MDGCVEAGSESSKGTEHVSLCSGSWQSNKGTCTHASGTVCLTDLAADQEYLEGYSMLSYGTDLRRSRYRGS